MQVVDLPQIIEKGELVVLTINSATSYFNYRGEPMGFQYELAQMFCHSIGVELKVKTVNRESELMRGLLAGAAELGMEVKFVATGGGSDGNFIAFEGCPVLDAVGPVGDGAHSAREALVLNTIGPRLELVYRTVLRLEAEGFFAEK